MTNEDDCGWTHHATERWRDFFAWFGIKSARRKREGKCDCRDDK